MKQRITIKSRNPIARVCYRVNKPQVVAPKKGKGSFKRSNKVDVDG